MAFLRSREVDILEAQLGHASLKERLVRVAVPGRSPVRVRLVMNAVPADHVVSAARRTEAHCEHQLPLERDLKQGHDLVALRTDRQERSSPIATVSHTTPVFCRL